MKNQHFRGTGVALVTPFSSQKVDVAALERLVRHVLDGGVEYLVALGTTGESVTLTSEEKELVVKTVMAASGGRCPVVVGVGGNNTTAVCQQLAWAKDLGAAAILSVSPSYNKPTQEGIYQHFKQVAQASELPIILYNVPGRTSSNMTAETTLRLAHEFSNIIAIKEASGNLEQCMAIVRGKPEHFLVISGEDKLTLPMMSFGMDGVISVIANAWPKAYSDMVRACLKGDFQSATPLHFGICDAIDGIFAEGNPGGIKALMASMNLCRNELRLPLWPVSESLAAKLALLKEPKTT